MAPTYGDLLAVFRALGRETERLIAVARDQLIPNAAILGDAEAALHRALEVFRSASDPEMPPRCPRCELPALDGDPRHESPDSCLTEIRGALRDAHAAIRAVMAPIRDLAPEESWETSIPTAHRADQVRHVYRFFDRWGRSFP